MKRIVSCLGVIAQDKKSKQVRFGINQENDMIEVKSVIDGTFKPTTLYECVEAGVVLARLSMDVSRGKSNLFGEVIVFARKIYGEFKEASLQVTGKNEQDSDWQGMAAHKFQSEFAACLAAGGAAGYSKKELDTFKNACDTIFAAMRDGLDILEQDNATGSYKWAAKNKIEQWNKKFKETKAEADKKARQQEAMKDPRYAKLFAVKGDKAETQAAGTNPEMGEIDAVLAQAPAELAAKLREYVKGMVNMAAMEGTVKFKEHDETFTEKALRLVTADISKMSNIFLSDMASIKKAANA